MGSRQLCAGSRGRSGRPPEGRASRVVRVVSLAILVAGASIPSQAQDQGSGAKTIPAASPGDMRLSDWVGATVEDSGGRVVGIVDDVMLRRDGHASLIVIGLAGALGLGEKDVAVPLSQVAGTRFLPERAATGVASGTGLYTGSSDLLVSIKPDLAALRSAPAFKAGSGQAAAGQPSSGSGVPEGVTKEPKSSTQSGGPG